MTSGPVEDYLSISLSNDLVESGAAVQPNNHEIAVHRVWRRRIAFPDRQIFFGGSHIYIIKKRMEQIFDQISESPRTLSEKSHG